MKVRLPILIIILICIFIKVKGQSEPIEKRWVKADSLFIINLAKAYKENPLKLEKLLSYHGNNQEKLGFDYYLVEPQKGKKRGLR
jgi:hypothetical protein